MLLSLGEARVTYYIGGSYINSTRVNVTAAAPSAVDWTMSLKKAALILAGGSTVPLLNGLTSAARAEQLFAVQLPVRRTGGGVFALDPHLITSLNLVSADGTPAAVPAPLWSFDRQSYVYWGLNLTADAKYNGHLTLAHTNHIDGVRALVTSSLGQQYSGLS